MEIAAIQRAFFYMSLGFPSKQGSLIKQNLTFLLKSLVKECPLHGPQIRPIWRKTPSSRALLNPLEHKAGCETVETSMSFACNSSFLSVDGMTCLIPFES